MRREREESAGSWIRPAEVGERWPELPEWASSAELDSDVRRDLRSLSKDAAEFVAGHLVAAGTLADDDPELAWRHARAARSQGSRIAVVRETAGLVAYRAGEWTEALAELRAARRMGGGSGHLAVMADCSRALGDPEKAIELARTPEAASLDPDGALELAIVVAGARADLGQVDAAIASLEPVAGQAPASSAARARLLFALADLREQAGRDAQALETFMAAADADTDDETDAAERATALADRMPAAEPLVPPTESSADPVEEREDESDAPEPRGAVSALFSDTEE